ncbi:cysteine-rich receptor-like protein kinase 2 isoform X2 [Salvia miltiorrhiza]|nr:cysteine-rich receptor-like protein kinase 2 isoform X2 [Salvia miltiorrhiza]
MRPNAMIIPMMILLFPFTSFADPRAQVIKLICGKQIEQNATINMANFISTMDKITVQMQASGHGAAATGSGRHASYGLAQCYGDLSPADCTLCYIEARNIMPRCYPSNGARVYLEGCFLRAQNYSFYHEYSGPDDGPVCGNRTRDDPGFEESLGKALSRAVLAASGNVRYARAEVAVVGAVNKSIHVLADCWRTIGASACRACLENASASALGCLPASRGRALNTGCFVEYSDSDFMNPVSRSGSSSVSVIINVIVAVSGAALLTIGAIIGVYLWKKRNIEKNRKDHDAENLLKNLNHNSLYFKYSTLDRATNSFDEANKLGQGGFGTVYKGVLADGREIGVKRLLLNYKHRATDFYNEINMISSLEHKNLVRLLGCSCSGPESLLVYEFCPNKSLDGFIFDLDKGKELNWEKRLKIIVGTAEGLVYLHENTTTRIIHRDIKASNVLLDSRMRAKIADFGLARSFQEDQSHISTAIAGTLGYMAPEYLAYGQLTEKADVYGFGVLVLEIVTGRRNNEGESSDYTESLLNRAWKHFKQGTAEQLVDPNLMVGEGNEINEINEMLRVVQVGLVCAQEIPSSRPSMSKALLMLEAKEQPPSPSNPPFMDKETMEFHYTSRGTSLSHGRGDDDASIATISHSVFLPR